jgi:hypothetical protein
MLYTWPAVAGHCVVIPLIVPGVAGFGGFTVTGSDTAALVPQLFPAVTLIFPFWPYEPAVTVTERFPLGPLKAHPVGIDQVYVVAFGTALIQYTASQAAGHWAVVPLMVPGTAGVPGLTVMVTVLEVAGLPVMQVAFEVITTYTWSPLTGT